MHRLGYQNPPLAKWREGKNEVAKGITRWGVVQYFFSNIYYTRSCIYFHVHPYEGSYKKWYFLFYCSFGLNVIYGCYIYVFILLLNINNKSNKSWSRLSQKTAKERPVKISLLFGKLKLLPHQVKTIQNMMIFVLSILPLTNLFTQIQICTTYYKISVYISIEPPLPTAIDLFAIFVLLQILQKYKYKISYNSSIGDTI